MKGATKKAKEPSNRQILTVLNRRFESVSQQFETIEKAMLNRDEFFAYIDKMMTREEFINYMEKVMSRLDNLAQDNTFGFGWLKRLDEDVTKIKTHLKLA